MRYRFVAGQNKPLLVALASTLLITAGHPGSAAKAAIELPPAPPAGATAPVIVTEDMKNFAAAMARIAGGEKAATALQAHYLDKASPGLRAFIQRRRVSAERLGAMVAARPRFYATLARRWRRPEQPLRAISRALAGLQRLYPQTHLLPVYLFVGDFSGGGNADPAGALIAVEFYSEAPGVELTELGTLRGSVHPLREIGHLAAHEMVHIQQAIAQGPQNYARLYDGSGTLLQWAIREGSADFLAELASGAHTNPRAHAYGRPRERELWRQFEQELTSTNVGSWMFGNPRRADWPPSIGYFIGYRIAQSYYRNSPARAQAIREILAASDAEAFLRRSKYVEGLSAGAR
jgi:hypothetical protein